MIDFNNNGSADIYVEDANGFADSVFGVISANQMTTRIAANLFGEGIRMRQDSLNQELVGQDDHPAFRIVDDALDALEAYLNA
jgi:hypothetical protein